MSLTLDLGLDHSLYSRVYLRCGTLQALTECHVQTGAQEPCNGIVEVGREAIALLEKRNILRPRAVAMRGVAMRGVAMRGMVMSTAIRRVERPAHVLQCVRSHFTCVCHWQLMQCGRAFDSLHLI